MSHQNDGGPSLRAYGVWNHVFGRRCTRFTRDEKQAILLGIDVLLESDMINFDKVPWPRPGVPFFKPEEQA